MPGKRRVVVHDCAERPVKKIERFAIIERRFLERLAFLRHAFGRVNKHAAPRTERHGGGFSVATRRHFSGKEIG
jgi:hypothetical protein